MPPNRTATTATQDTHLIRDMIPPVVPHQPNDSAYAHDVGVSDRSECFERLICYCRCVYSWDKMRNRDLSGE